MNAVFVRLGRYDTMIVSLFFYVVYALGFWLPNIFISDGPNTGLLIVCVLIFGFASGCLDCSEVYSMR